LKEENNMIVFKAAQEQVLGALQSVAGIVERRHTLPILANVLMRKTAATPATSAPRSALAS
jgi:DNA polymerase III subunit beta